MIKTVFLDMDGTLLDFYKSESVALSKVLQDFKIEATDEKIKLYSAINLSQWKRLEKGEIDRERVLVGRFEIFFDQLGETADASQARRLYEKYLSQGHYFIDGAEDLLEILSKKYDLYIATNGTKKVQLSRIASSGIEKYFKDIFISEDLGCNKPDKLFFEKCFEKIRSIDLSKTVIIGDSLSSDILGGNNAGIKTVWFNPLHEENNKSLRIDFETDDLSDIPGILEKL
ncbi:MAG: YjjG family noncanonical pyrimidine nucleotidase [Clostridia bacterium]|nr:YjjG family noncanonical pyrimidine nucleotidase [Clostridia bacterium]